MMILRLCACVLKGLMASMWSSHFFGVVKVAPPFGVTASDASCASEQGTPTGVA